MVIIIKVIEEDMEIRLLRTIKILLEMVLLLPALIIPNRMETLLRLALRVP